MRLLGRLLWLGISIALVLFAVIFATSNETLITLRLWPFESTLTAPIWLLILSSFIIGGLMGAITLWGQWLAVRAKLWRLQGQFNKLQANADKLGAASAAAPHPVLKAPARSVDADDQPAALDQLTADRRLH
jgi:uncharacterized integral membrane protein